MSPDIQAQLRVLLAAVAGFVVGKGWIEETIAEALVGLIVLAIPAVWAWWSNRPQSSEAIKIAESVADSDAPGAAHIIERAVPPQPE